MWRHWEPLTEAQLPEDKLHWHPRSGASQPGMLPIYLACALLLQDGGNTGFYFLKSSL